MNVIECVHVCLCVCVGYERNYMIYLEGLGFPPQEKAEIRNLKIMSWRLFGMVILSRIALTGSFLLADAWNAPWNLWWLHNVPVTSSFTELPVFIQNCQSTPGIAKQPEAKATREVHLSLPALASFESVADYLPKATCQGWMLSLCYVKFGMRVSAN